MAEPARDSDRPVEPADTEGHRQTPSSSQPLPPPPPVPPDALKPWYYQGWFIVPTFVWWPCSAILFIRSPWHNGVVSGAVSWAWIIVGGGWIFLRTQLRWQSGEPLMDPTLLALIAPGLALTVSDPIVVADEGPATHPSNPGGRRIRRLRIGGNGERADRRGSAQRGVVATPIKPRRDSPPAPSTVGCLPHRRGGAPGRPVRPWWRKPGPWALS